ncbi:VOC family protein [Candidatus Nucleicultrix amoebiphila]|jgi:catechol 2,3-dioxygenase-like lactoylglutathione lyase family enzyme|uniref:VOC domain-containing protein n=1 Tax=Candidatus Nucleicultrix amoebiphila FS5 TaxID=1414854 RepID=A0A1W6N3N3_9PROT|nr:VOC family protein [Candidatus Nucleicultrix amoebiphila]ARN84368.1 hypothetical protein GQ61_02405 [Candidatus Nucleicultrix amoebiphila FS5]
MIDHASFSVNNFSESLNFYDKTLKLIGYERLMTFDTEDVQAAGYGKNNKPDFWISPQGSPEEQIGQARGVHLAFQAPDVLSIKRWYNKCLELGGLDNGAPGPRPEYHEGYYAAFIIDPNGWRIEAVIHDYKEK